MRELIKIFVAAGLMTTTEAAINTVFPPFLDRRGFVVGEIGVIFALFAVAQLFTRMPSGLLYRRQRGPLVVALSLAFFGASTAAYAVIATPPFLILWTVIHGVAFGIAGTVLLAMAFDARPEGYRTGAVMGWYTALLAGGHGAGNSLSGLIADHLGFGTAFLIAGALQIPAVLACWSVHPAPRAVAPSAAAASPRGSWDRTWHALRTPGVIQGSLLGFYMQALDMAINAFFPIFGLGAGLSLTTVGVVKTVKNIFAASVRAGTGYILHRIPLNTLNVLLVLAFGLAAFVLPFAYGPVAFALIFVVVGLCRGLLRATSAALLVEGKQEMGGRRMGVASGVYNSALDVGGIAGPVIAGAIAGLVGIGPMFQIMAVSLLGVAMLAIFWLRRLSPGEHVESTTPAGQSVP